MRKYIDADRLEKDGWSMQRTYKSSATEMVCEMKNPTDFPAADVVEVRHGRWEHVWGDEWRCTACAHIITTEGSWERPRQKYCEECGAKMDEEKVMQGDEV